VFYGSLQLNLHHLHMCSGVPYVNRARQVKCGLIHLKVGIQCVLFSIGQCNSSAQG